MDKKPLIGVLPLYDPKKDSYWMLPKYMEALEAAGALALILPPRMTAAEREQILDLCDGLLFPGGQDVEPTLYGMERSRFCGQSAKRRDDLEFPLFREAYARNMPILGICRGMQLMNTALGGTLYQHLPHEMHDVLNHDMTAPYDRVYHMATLLEGTPLRQMLGCIELGVNSYHHQAVKDVAPDLKVMAVAPDGVVEAVYAPEKRFVWGIQWHPEYFWREAQGCIFRAFVESCKSA